MTYCVDRHLRLHYRQEIEAHIEQFAAEGNKAKFLYRAGSAEGRVFLRAWNAEILYRDGSIWVNPLPGETEYGILLAAGALARTKEILREMNPFAEIGEYFASAEEGWKLRWGESIPDLRGKPWNQLFLRSVFHILCSWGPSNDVVAPPCGWSGNGWPFEFPQDVAFVNHAVLALGMTDLAKARVEFYARFMDEMHEYTRRVYNAEGTMWAWIFPIGADSRILVGKAPNYYHYEIHNAVYPAQMAYETAAQLQDPIWTRYTAWPIVRESARFFSSVLRKNGATWGIHVEPSMGQDEFGGQNGNNYLCALYAARYSLTIALEMAREIDGALSDMERELWQEILKEGLAFETLEDAELGIYRTCAEEGFMLGNMKHPIELLPWSTLLWPVKNEWEKRAYQKRYLLCANSDENRFHGWTLAKIGCAEANAGDEEAFADTFARMVPSQYTDPSMLQIYESSGAKDSSYYVTSEGLFAWAAMTIAQKHGVQGKDD